MFFFVYYHKTKNIKNNTLIKIYVKAFIYKIKYWDNPKIMNLKEITYIWVQRDPSSTALFSTVAFIRLFAVSAHSREGRGNQGT